MPELPSPYILIEDALSPDDLLFLRDACKRHVTNERMPCYVLIDHLESPTCLKIKQVLERHIGAPLYYLNDFYMYTDASFRTGWHMDTELFAFDAAINAWILLSPDGVDDPLGFIADINEAPRNHFHSMTMEDDQCVFVNYCTGDELARWPQTIEAQQIHTPHVRRGDILALNPKHFHRTNTTTPKHAIAIKFVLKGATTGFLSSTPVDPQFWPEVEIFSRLAANARSWDAVLAGIQRMLTSEAGRKELSAGFYPEQFELYLSKVATL